MQFLGALGEPLAGALYQAREDALGFMGEKSAVTKILNDTYVFPEECDEVTRRICKEASKIYVKIANETITSFVKKKEFQDWWRTANEDIQSSMEGIHFGHLKTAAWNDQLTSLYIAKLNASLRGGFPLERWEKA